MSSGVLWALSFALILAAAGVWLWRGSQMREESAHTRRFFDSRLEQATRAAGAGVVPGGAAAGSTARGASSAAVQPGQAATPAVGLAAWRAGLRRCCEASTTGPGSTRCADCFACCSASSRW